jgi:putative transposase
LGLNRKTVRKYIQEHKNKVLSGEFSILTLCQVLNVSRSAYYAYLNGRTYVLKGAKKELTQDICDIFESHKCRYGSRRIQAELAYKNKFIGRYQIRKRMVEQGLKVI